MVHNIPRHSNPHLLPGSSKATSRNNLWATESDEDAPDTEPDDFLLENLNERISNALDTSVAYQTTPAELPEPQTTSQDVELVFRLWSTSHEPQTIKLFKFPANHRIQRPKRQCEDTKSERKERRRRAKECAVDPGMIHAQHRSSVVCPEPQNKTSSLTSYPPFFIVSQLRPLRKTHPPVPPSDITYHPYSTTGRLNPCELQPEINIPVTTLHDLPTPKLRRTRHRRKKHGQAATRDYVLSRLNR